MEALEFTSSADGHRSTAAEPPRARGRNGIIRDPLLHSAPVKISLDEIRHVALLARLALTPTEETELATTLDQILQHMDKLNQLDTSDVEPTAHIVAVDVPWREDVVTNAPDTEALLANAPARDDDLFLVPKIID